MRTSSKRDCEARSASFNTNLSRHGHASDREKRHKETRSALLLPRGLISTERAKAARGTSTMPRMADDGRQWSPFPLDITEPYSAEERPGSKYIGSFRWKVFQTFENPDFSEYPVLAKLISVVVMTTILVSSTTFIFESEACEPTSFLPANPTLVITLFIEVVSVAIFSMCAQGLGHGVG